MLELQPGKHSIAVQWRKWGNTVRSWRSNPALLDGYASARFISAMGERQSVAATQNLLQAKQNERGWNTVGDSILSFHLHAPAAVLFSYGLPITQHEHPTFDKWSYERWSSIAARLVVDGHPYRTSASSTDGTVHKVVGQRGQLMLELQLVPTQQYCSGLHFTTRMLYRGQLFISNMEDSSEGPNS